jgi:hypothetical protein
VKEFWGGNIQARYFRDGTVLEFSEREHC